MRRAIVVLLLIVLAACKRQETRHPKPLAPKPVRTEVGDVMPAYGANDLDGKAFDVASRKGAVTLLNVWATWCGPCVYEIPQLNAIHQQFVKNGFEVVGISVDDTGVEGVRQFVQERKIVYPVTIDPDGRIANLLGTSTIPTSVLIGRDGKIAWRKTGAITGNDEATLTTAIEKALAAK
jgi:thiol-disulfide isomerase/thioredoxin